MQIGIMNIHEMTSLDEIILLSDTLFVPLASLWYATKSSIRKFASGLGLDPVTTLAFFWIEGEDSPNNNVDRVSTWEAILETIQYNFKQIWIIHLRELIMQSFVCRPLWTELCQIMWYHKRTTLHCIDFVHRYLQFFFFFFLGYQLKSGWSSSIINACTIILALTYLSIKV